MDPESGEDLWAVVHIGACLAADGAWEYEPPPSLRNDNWLARCLFSRKEALRRAAVTVNQIKFNAGRSPGGTSTMRRAQRHPLGFAPCGR